MSAATARSDALAGAVRPLAPEEIRAGDYVVVLRETVEYPAVLWCCDTYPAGDDAVLRIPFMPERGGVPRRVEVVYLPYVLAKPPQGAPETLDVRRHQIARVNRDHARAIWRALGKRRKRRKGK